MPPLATSAEDDDAVGRSFPEVLQTKRSLSVEDVQSIEIQILSALYQSSSGNQWTVSTSWLNDFSHCDWFGITCNDDGHVIKIELGNNNLKGSVPLRALLRLPYLKVLKLDGNSIDSHLVAEADMKLWEGIIFDDTSSSASTTVSSLQYIDLSHTDVLSGKISNLYSPSYIVNPDQSSSPMEEKQLSYPYLNDLYLSGCTLRSAPTEQEWITFGAVERWVIDDNMMSGTIPTNVHMNNLRVFSANGNKLRGKLNGFEGMEKLRHLSLRGNQFQGDIPTGLRCDDSTYSGAKMLEILDLSNQSGMNEDGSIGLIGDLPSFSQCENLRRLDLSRNSIGGLFPVDFLKSVDPLVFEVAMLNSNRIEGTLPSSLKMFDSDAITIYDNKIGGVDDSLCDSSRSGAIAAFGCDAVLCPPGKFFPGTGRQEEVGDECKICESSKYWGETTCNAESSTSAEDNASPPAETPTIEVNDSSEEEQKAILMQLFESTKGDSWMHNNGWVRHESISVCDWYGVECSPGTKAVERVDLQSNNLQGRLPTSVFHLQSLKTLVLKDNNVFPTRTDAVDFFVDIHKAVSLEILDLSSTGLPVVTGIGHASTSLQELHLDLNSFASTIPDEIYTITNLKTLSLDNCNLSGEIDNSIFQLTNLVLLSLSDNHLTGHLPPELSYLKSLSTLRLQNNNLVGTIPASFNGLTSLTYLDLSGQKRDDSIGLEGPLRDFSETKSMKRLDLSSNSISGPIPGFFLASVDQETFEFADLSNNLLVSSVPAELSPIANKVYLQQNHITGIQEICDAAEKVLPLSGCDELLCAPGTYNSLGRSTSADPCLKCGESNSNAQFFGSVTCSGDETSYTQEDAIRLIYSSCSGAEWISHTSWLSDTISVCKWEGITCSDGNVTDINLRSNGLSCAFPLKEMAQALPSLNTLALEGNSHVSIDFTSIESPLQLKALDITNTKVQSLEGIGRLNGLVELHASSNSLKGLFPEEILHLTYLERLTLSFNNFVGQLPNDIGFELRQMKVLSLDHNSFSGTLPSSIGKMSSIQYLDIQANELTGTIPKEVLEISGLQSLDLSDQKGFGLSGSLPRGFISNQLQTLDLSGNSFSGSVPDDFLSSSIEASKFSLDLSSNLLTGELPGILSRFPMMNLDFSDNKITSISSDLCSDDCDMAMILCAPTTYSETGRQPSENEYCQHCPHALYWGTTSCSESVPSKQPNVMTSEVSDTDSEVDIVRLIYESCGGAGWFNKDNWMTSQSICTWYGIKCDDTNNVKSIILSSNNLQGVFPPNVFFLPSLETLALDSNNLQFSFSSIKNALKLSTFDISETGLFKLEGIQDAPALLSLDISANSFKHLPMEVFQLSTLQQLYMGSNNFQTSMPTNVGDLQQLKLLSISSSYLKGSIPASIGNLAHLVHLNLEDNALTGSLPREIETLENLAFLDLSDQSLRGQLPTFKTNRDLRRLDLSKNSFTGTIPAEFLSGINPLFFDYLDVSSNFLKGTVPSVLAHFDSIYLQDNQFTHIDDSLCDLSRGEVFKKFGCDAILCPPGTYNVLGMQDSEMNSCDSCPGSLYLGATSCNVTDSLIPIDNLELLSSDVVQEKKALSIFYRKCGGEYWTSNSKWLDNRLSHCHWYGIQCHNGTKSVKSIILGSNNVLGTPPQEFFELLPNLNTLHLNSNPLSSFNFHWLEKVSRLTDINLDATGLISLDGIQSTSSLRRLSLRSNYLTGPFPLELLELKTLTSLIIGHNDFTGPIPIKFDELPYLQTLILNDNELTGNIEHITFPPTIKLLDLSNNKLSGSVPSSFLHNIPASVDVRVDLSNNQITEIHESVCTKKNLNNGDVEKYGCSGLLCPAGYYSNTGRHSQIGKCVYCPTATYLGSSICSETKPHTDTWIPILCTVLIVGLVAVVGRKIKQSRDLLLHNQDVESLILQHDGELT